MPRRGSSVRSTAPRKVSFKLNNTETSKSKNVCRACNLCTAQVNIFRNGTGENCVHKLMMSLCDIQIEEGDGLPSEICNKCLRSLKAAYQFIKQCEATDRILRHKPDIKIEDVEIKPTSVPANIKSEPSNYDPNMELESYSHDTSTSSDSQPSSSQGTSFTKQQTDNFNEQIPEVVPTTSQIQVPLPMTTMEGIARTLEACAQENSAIQIVPIKIIADPVIKKSKPRKNAVCAVCYQKFEDYEDYQAHVRTHNGEVVKPYKCKECGKGFLCISQLNRHMFVHSDVKLYECHICNKGFNNASHMKSHMYVHSGEKPYSCTVCNKRFNQMPHLRRHLLSHSEFIS